MKILHTSDWHIGNFPGPEKDGINLRAQDINNCLDYLIKTAKEEQPDLIVVAGDIFHTAKVWADRGLNETNKAIEIIKKLSAISPICVLRGTPNHDNLEAFSILKSVFPVLLMDQNIYIFDTPITKVINTKSGNITVAALPGFDKGEFRAKFPGISKEEENIAFTGELGKIVFSLKAMCNPAFPSILVSHYTVPGCNTESGQTQFLSTQEPVLLPEVLDSTNFDLVALGHIHRPQRVDSCKNTYYSGAINALNFNDEGQGRGFWIHTLNGNSREVYNDDIHKFIPTPYREFQTLSLDDTEITDLNNGCGINEMLWCSDIAIDNKIVRIHYSCTDENNKALNKALLEKQLYEAGAFWVQEITPEKITITANKDQLSEKNTPEDNLRTYLAEKAMTDEQIDRILELARPIIAEASAGSITAMNTGLFIPIEIAVKNYRNYQEETFNFSDISFCTINGKNGAGKSTLFMDAILDCLYEEPREGDLTGWISNNEKARSGSIQFTFGIGDKTYRVTRTRTKSGKATLNLSELVEGEWQNRSKEKLKDTQDEITNILGMDSLTMKSCALIMQDQYGLFLQADKESRMNILGNILGLGIYGQMEDMAKDKATEINRDIRSNKDQVEKLTESLPDGEEISSLIDSNNINIKSFNLDIQTYTTEADSIKLKLNNKLEAATRALKLTESINTLNRKKHAIEDNKHLQEGMVNNSNIILSQEEHILSGVQKYNSLLAQEKELLTGKALHNTKEQEYLKIGDDIQAVVKEIAKLNYEKIETQNKMQPLADKISIEKELKAKSENYIKEKATLLTLEEKAGEYIKLGNEISDLEKQKAKLDSEYDSGYATRTAEYKNLKSKAALLDNSGCIDKENAKCKFLKDAQEAKAKIEPYSEECKMWQSQIVQIINELEQKIIELNNKRNELDYDSELIKNKRVFVNNLEKSHREYEAVTGYKEQLKLIDETIETINKRIIGLEDTLKIYKESRNQVKNQLDSLKEMADKYNSLILDIEVNKKWLDKEKLLPVAREKKETAEARIQELDKELLDIVSDLITKQNELEEEQKASIGHEQLKQELLQVEAQIKYYQEEVQKLSMNIGACKKQLETLEQSKIEIKKLNVTINELAEKAAVYEELKKAFGQDGVPHNIIRSIVPMLEATANNILGQMSGGKMNMEFVTEKILKSNSKKEVVTLDIIINEIGIGRLPYLSKSGGERVKSALSAILALAETKSSRAGIQLGMLFIDEPPFLDADGIQAYCDALETIQNRYRNLKIMAITHDPAMKARFPQYIEVVKTPEGSKVIY